MLKIYNSFMNFLYCFDEKFNLQALNSVKSVIDNSTRTNTKFFIIHDNPETFQKLIKKHLNNHQQRFNYCKFDLNTIEFPRLKNSHVSKATYFRLFFQKYIPDDIEFITYIDADIICVSKNLEKLNEKIIEISLDKTLIGAVTESIGGNNQNRLGMHNEKYFNAGVMIINLKLWRKNFSLNQILDRMSFLKENILWWDQDVLNSLVDGNYTEIDSGFNKQVGKIDKKFNKNDIFLHYSGKVKPWSVSFFEDNRNKFYQDCFKNLNITKYHIEYVNKLDNFVFLKNLILGHYKKYGNFEIIKSYLKFK